jgi:hypothetical protein
MIDSHSRSNVAFVVGVFAIGLGLMETLSGEALRRYGQMAYRREDSRTFWEAVTGHYLGGVAAIAYFLYERFVAY